MKLPRRQFLHLATGAAGLVAHLASASLSGAARAGDCSLCGRSRAGHRRAPNRSMALRAAPLEHRAPMGLPSVGERVHDQAESQQAGKTQPE
jgi:hypothetical protein